MSKKKILIIGNSFYPINSPRSFRTTELSKEFARMGHEVTVLTVKDNEYHTAFEKEYNITIEDLGPLRFPTIRPPKEGKFLNYFFRVLKRGTELLFEYPDIELMFKVKKALGIENGYDLLISVAVPHPIHWGVAFARTRKNPIAQVWAADCGDPYMGFDIDIIGKPFYFKYLEKLFCRKADYITVPIEGAKNAYYKEFRHKIRVIPQGFKFDDVMIDNGKYSPNHVPIFGFAGSLQGGGRDPNKLLEYLVNLDNKYKFVIYTQNHAPALPFLEKAKDRIELREYIPRDSLLKELSKMDFLVNLENNTNSQLPSKLIDYYLTGRPVLSISSSILNTDVIDQFLKGDYSKKYLFKNMDRYEIENVCNKFLGLLGP